MCVHVQLVQEDEGIQEGLPADVARVRGHTVLQNKAGKGCGSYLPCPRNSTVKIIKGALQTIWCG